jgi:hypothetical protein
MRLGFSLQEGTKEIACAISTSAMVALERGPCAPPSEREEQFMRLRERIEACVERKYQASEFEVTPPGIVLRSIDFRGRGAIADGERGDLGHVTAIDREVQRQRLVRPAIAAIELRLCAPRSAAAGVL